MNLRRISVLFSISLLLFGCSEEVRKKFEPRPVAFGPLNQLVVVADQALWESEVGETFDYYFGAPYPILPQPEPIYDIKHYTPEQLLSLKERKELRTYVFLADAKSNSSRTAQLIRSDLGDEKVNAALEGEGFKTSIAKDKWADGQLLVYIMGAGPEKIQENIKRSFGAVIKRIREADEGKLAAGIYLEGTDNELKAEVRNKMGVSLELPVGYLLAMHDTANQVIWLRLETDEVSSNILLKKMAYTDQQQFSKDGIKAIQDTLGQYVSTRIPNTYMRINDVDLPMLLETMTLNGYYTVEARGVWEIENDYMGGPFVSYLMRNANTNELLFVNGFIHAPGQEKRRYMQELEHVIRSVKF